MHPPRWHLLGAGSIGGWFAARLAARGLPVTLLLRDAASLARWHDAGGFSLTGPDGTLSHAGPPAVEALAPGPGAEAPTRVVVATKAQDTLEALTPLVPGDGAGQLVLLLQNGMGTGDLLRARFPRLRLWQAVTTAGVWRESEFALRVVAEGETLAGRLDDAGNAMLDTAIDEMAGSGVLALADDIRSVLWRKLAINAVINALTAIHGCRNGELAEIPAARVRFAPLAQEVERVAAAEGIHFDEPVLAMAERVMRLTAHNFSSMNRDAAAGRATEIDSINGYIVARAARHGIPVPANAAVTAAVRALPRRGRRT